MRTSILLRLSAAVLLPLASCSSVAPTRSGFLPDYATLAQRGDARLEFRAPAQPWPSTRFALAPIEWRAATDELDAQRRETIRRAFERDLQRGLETALERGELGASDTLTVRAAITDFEPTAIWSNVLSVAALGLAFDNGGATVEFEVLAPDGAALLRTSWARSGSVFAPWRGFSSTSFGRKALRELAAELGESVAAAAQRGEVRE